MKQREGRSRRLQVANSRQIGSTPEDPIFSPNLTTVIQADDIVAVLGRTEVLVKILGPTSSETTDSELLEIPVAPYDLHVTSKDIAGKTFQQIVDNVELTRGVLLRAITRGGLSLPIGANVVVDRGDVLHVTGPEPTIEKLAPVIGRRINEEARKGTVAISPVTHRFVVIFQSHGSFQRAAEVFSRITSAVWLGRRWVTLAALLFAIACSRTPPTTHAPPAGDGWHQFQGTWTAAGSRISIPLGNGRRASTAKFEGSLVLAGTSRPAVGFRAESIVFNDTATGMVGRAVWTDDRGDQIFSEITGNGDSTGNHFVGRFLGGTGRYTGASGDYEFAWRFVAENEDGNVQGQSMGLNGKIHVGLAQAMPDARGPR